MPFEIVSKESGLIHADALIQYAGPFDQQDRKIEQNVSRTQRLKQADAPLLFLYGNKAIHATKARRLRKAINKH